MVGGKLLSKVVFCKPLFKEMCVTCYTNIDYRFFQDISSCSQQEPWLIKVKIGYCDRNPYSIPTKMNVNECLRCLIRNIPHPSLWQTVTEKLFDLSICRKRLVFQMYPASPRWSQHQWLQLCFWVELCTRWTTSGCQASKSESLSVWFEKFRIFRGNILKYIEIMDIDGFSRHHFLSLLVR